MRDWVFILQTKNVPVEYHMRATLDIQDVIRKAFNDRGYGHVNVNFEAKGSFTDEDKYKATTIDLKNLTITIEP